MAGGREMVKVLVVLMVFKSLTCCYLTISVSLMIRQDATTLSAMPEVIEKSTMGLRKKVGRKARCESSSGIHGGNLQFSVHSIGWRVGARG